MSSSHPTVNPAVCEIEAVRALWSPTVAPLPSGVVDTLVVGAGIVGASVAYHLASPTHSVAVLEQSLIGGGTTFHAAGLVGQMRASSALTQLNKYSAQLYAALEAETGAEWQHNSSSSSSRRRISSSSSSSNIVLMVRNLVVSPCFFSFCFFVGQGDICVIKVEDLFPLLTTMIFYISPRVKACPRAGSSAAR